MSDVNETLQELLERRLKELGHRRGRGEQISLNEAYDRLVSQAEADADIPTYEVFRRIRLGHSKITDRTAVALATMLEVDVDEVLLAAGQRARPGRFELPRRADGLDDAERQVVLGVVDAILNAAKSEQRRPVSPSAGQRPLKAVAKGGARSDADEADRIARRARGQQSAD